MRVGSDKTPIFDNPGKGASGSAHGMMGLHEHLHGVNEAQPIDPHRIKVRDPDLMKMDGNVWTCQEKKPNPAGGSLITFQLKPDYCAPDGMDEEFFNLLAVAKRDLFFPGIEPTQYEVEDLLADPYEDNPLIQLGFACGKNAEGQFFLTIPDKEALLANWNTHFREKYGELAIAECEEILGHLDFAELYAKGADGVLSIKEFVHDMMMHVVPRLKQRFHSPQLYQEAKEAVNTKTLAIIEKIRKLKQPANDQEKEYLHILEMTLGASIDTVTNIPDYDQVEGIFSMLISTLPKAIFDQEDQAHELFKKMFQKQFQHDLDREKMTHEGLIAFLTEKDAELLALMRLSSDHSVE